MKKKEKIKTVVNLGLSYGELLGVSSISPLNLLNNAGIPNSGKMICKVTGTDWTGNGPGTVCQTIYYDCTDSSTKKLYPVSITNCGSGKWHGVS